MTKLSSTVKIILAAVLLILTQLLVTLPAHADSLPSGTLIKGPFMTSVYLIKDDGKRHPFPLQSIFESRYGRDFSKVQTVSADELASYSLGANVAFAPNSIIKIVTDPKVYKVLDDQGTIEWIQTELEFLTQGFSFKEVKDVPDTFFLDYTMKAAAPVTSPEPAPAVPTPPVTEAPFISTVRITTPNYTDAQVYFTTNRVTTDTVELLDSNGSVLATNELLTSAMTHETSFRNILTPAQKYSLRITSKTADWQTVSRTDAFMSKTDVLVTHVIDEPQGSEMMQPNVVTARMRITNQSTSPITIDKFVLIFESPIPARMASIAKNISIQVSPVNSIVQNLVANKSIGSGVVWTNTSGFQAINTDYSLDPGVAYFLTITIDGLQNIGRDDITIGAYLRTILDKLYVRGDFSVYREPEKYGELIVK